jgi:hypothetical protein
VASLDDIVALTAAIEARVEAGDWPGAATLDGQRRTLLADLLSARPGGLDRTARGVLEELLARNRATLARVEQERAAVGAALQALAQSPAALRAYGRAAADPVPALAGSTRP